MQCSDFQQRLQRLLDQRRAPEGDPRLNRHADRCPACKDLLDAQEQLLAGLELAEVPPLPADFARRTVARAGQVRLRGRLVAAAAVMAAVAALLLLALLPLFPGQPPQQVARPRGDLPHAPGVVGTAVPGRLPDVRQPTVSRESDEYDPEAVRMLLQQLVGQLDAARQRSLEPVDQIAGGLRPLATTLNVAIDALRQSIPVGRDNGAVTPQANSAQWLDSLRVG